MPPQMGELISEAIYDNRLNSNPHHLISNQTIACHFVDVSPSVGREKGKDNSYMVSFQRVFHCHFTENPSLE
jgi:regulator of nonsense transcripts 1